MVDAFGTLFPQVTVALQGDSANHEAWSVRVSIETNGHIEWGYGGPLVREGMPLPIANVKLGDRSAFEVFLQNQLRIDIQRKIEASIN